MACVNATFWPSIPEHPGADHPTNLREHAADLWLPDNLNAFLPEKADITPIERALAGFMGVI